MTPKEVVDGLKLIKEWDPRPFILDICDAAITYVEAYGQADEVPAVEPTAEEVSATSEDATAGTATGETPTTDAETPARTGRTKK